MSEFRSTGALESDRWSLRRMMRTGVAVLGLGTTIAMGAHLYRMHDANQAAAFAEATTPEALGETLNDCSYRLTKSNGITELYLATDFNSDQAVKLNNQYDTLLTNRQVSVSTGMPGGVIVETTNGGTTEVTTVEVPRANVELDKRVESYEARFPLVGVPLTGEVVRISVQGSEVSVYPQGFGGPHVTEVPIIPCQPIQSR